MRRLLASGGGAVEGQRCLTRPLGAAVFRMAPHASASPRAGLPHHRRHPQCVKEGRGLLIVGIFRNTHHRRAAASLLFGTTFIFYPVKGIGRAMLVCCVGSNSTRSGGGMVGRR